MPLEFFILQIVIAMERGELGRGGAVTGAALQTAVAV
jgi:hypothetical protein